MASANDHRLHSPEEHEADHDHTRQSGTGVLECRDVDRSTLRRFFRSLGSGEDFGRGDSRCPADAGERVHSRRFVVIFEQAEVRAVDARRDRNLFLGQLSGLTRLP